jgi:hypothetical protein
MKQNHSILFHEFIVRFRYRWSGIGTAKMASNAEVGRENMPHAI